MTATPFISLSNGERISFTIGSGGLAFDGRGWPWERPLEQVGIIDISLFAIVAKSIGLEPREGYLKRLWWPFNCIRPIHSGWVNKVGLTNPGSKWWYHAVGKHVNREEIKLIGSGYGSRAELVELARIFNDCDLIGNEGNYSCPNSGHALEKAEAVVGDVEAVCAVSEHPVFVKLSADQPYLDIARLLTKRSLPVAGISWNSVPWATVYPNKRSPLHRLEKRVGGGGGGVSGQAAQPYNWKAISELAHDPENKIPIIGASVWRYEDVGNVFQLGAQAVSFGSISILRPWAPTQYVRRWKKEHNEQ